MQPRYNLFIDDQPHFNEAYESIARNFWFTCVFGDYA